jgi:tRNA/rRNA methyltransferase
MLEGYYEHLEAVLLKIGYLYPHTAQARMEKFRHFLNRAMPTTEEVAMLRGILRQIEWALQFQPKSVSGDKSEPNES